MNYQKNDSLALFWQSNVYNHLVKNLLDIIKLISMIHSIPFENSLDTLEETCGI